MARTRPTSEKTLRDIAVWPFWVYWTEYRGRVGTGSSPIVRGGPFSSLLTVRDIPKSYISGLHGTSPEGVPFNSKRRSGGTYQGRMRADGRFRRTRSHPARGH